MFGKNQSLVVIKQNPTEKHVLCGINLINSELIRLNGFTLASSPVKNNDSSQDFHIAFSHWLNELKACEAPCPPGR